MQKERYCRRKRKIMDEREMLKKKLKRKKRNIGERKNERKELANVIFFHFLKNWFMTIYYYFNISPN